MVQEQTTTQDRQASRISEDVLLGYPDISPETHEMTAILQFRTSFELVDYLARLMPEFDKHDIDTTVQFEAYEAERQRQTP
mgnify:FL=1